MAFARLTEFGRDESGGVLLEFTIAATFFFTLLFGAVEFTYAFYQWNVATKATQLGARIAAVSTPVADAIKPENWDGLDPAIPGEPVPVDDQFDITCEYVSGSLQCSEGDADTVAFEDIVYGVNEDPDAARSCSDGESATTTLGMCDVFYRIKPENVVIRYQYTGMGYAGRPGGAVPTITVSLKELNYDFVVMGTLAGIAASKAFPKLTTTISGEDLNAFGS